MELMLGRTPSEKTSYYYAGGKRVPLNRAADLIAVDVARLESQLPDLLASDSGLRAGRPLRDGIRLLERDSLSPATITRLQDAGVTQPVFRAQGSIVVALPEVRVEDGSATKLAKARAAAEGKAKADADEGRLTLRPSSDNGADAIALANELVEQLDVASATPRFIRVVPRPGT